jgi:6,7-dimethyl-8-ribityllumazine synthase
MRDTPVIEGATDASGLRVCLVVSVYHRGVTGALRDGALAALRGAGARGAAPGEPGSVILVEVPGAFEIPLAARRAAESGAFDAVVCLGCIVRGETPHFDYLASAVAHAIATASQATGVAMTFGVLTTNSLDEAAARAGDGPSNKGREAALAAVQLANVIGSLPGAPRAGT